MIQYLDPEQAHAIIDRLGFCVRDAGLLHSALARPAATLFGVDAYPTLDDKAAALMSSLAQNHPLFDGNKRTALILTLTFVKLNGGQVTFSQDDAFDLVLLASQSQLDLPEMAARFRRHVRTADTA